MDSPRRSTTNRSRSISITTRRASASSSSQVRTRRIPAVRAPAVQSSSDGDAADDDAADRSRDRPRPGRHNHTSRRVASILFFPPLLARIGTPRASRSIAGRPSSTFPNFFFFPARACTPPGYCWSELHSLLVICCADADSINIISKANVAMTTPVDFYLRDIDATLYRKDYYR